MKKSILNSFAFAIVTVIGLAVSAQGIIRAGGFPKEETKMPKLVNKALKAAVQESCDMDRYIEMQVYKVEKRVDRIDQGLEDTYYTVKVRLYEEEIDQQYQPWTTATFMVEESYGYPRIDVKVLKAGDANACLQGKRTFFEKNDLRALDI